MRRRWNGVAAGLVLSMLVQSIAVWGLGGGRAAQAAPSSLGKVPAKEQWVEEPQRRTAYARHYKAGNFRAVEVSATPLHFKDENGQWQRVQVGLIDQPDSGISTTGGGNRVHFTNQDQGNRIRFDLGKGQIIQLALDEDGLIPQEPNGPARRARFRVSKKAHKVTYSESNGMVDYEYEVHERGVKENIYLHKFTGKHQFLLPIAIQGLQIREEQNGGYTLMEHGTGIIRAIIPPPVVTDGAGVVAPWVEQTLIPLGDGMAFRLQVDREWLQAHDRKYPVVIDPGVIIAPEGADLMTATINAPSGGQPNLMQVMKNNLGAESRSLIKFDLNELPQGAIIQSATFDVDRSTSLPSLPVQQVLTEWLPEAATWNSPRGQGSSWPAGGETGATGLGNLSTGPVALTSVVQAWANRTSGNYGLLIRPEFNMSTIDLKKPTLQVVYSLDGLAPTVSVTPSGDVGVVRTAFPLTANVTDPSPASGIQRVELLVNHVVVETKVQPAGPRSEFTVDPRQFGPGTHTALVRAFDFAGGQATSQPVPFTAAIPESPRMLTAAGAELKWDPPIGASGLTYKIYRSTTRQVLPSSGDGLASGLIVSSYTDTTLPAAKAEGYYYSVTAVDVSGAESQPTTVEVRYPFEPGQPQVKLDADKVPTVSWFPSVRAGVTYNLYRGDNQGFTPSVANRVATSVTGIQFRDTWNLLKNGSFETAPNSSADWCCNGSQYTMQVDTSTAKVGTSSLKMWQGPYTNQLTQQVPLTGPRTVTLSGWSKAQNVLATGSYSISMSFLDSAGNTINFTSALVYFTGGTHDWEQKSVTASAPSNTAKVQVRISDGNSGTVWFDAVQVEFGGEVTTYKDYKPVTTPYYRISAVDGPVESALTDEAGTVDPGVPLSPGQLTLQELGRNRVALSWQASGSPDVTYSMWRRTTCCDPPSNADLVASGVMETTFVDGINRGLNTSFEQVSTTSGEPYNWVRNCGDICPQIVGGGYSGSAAAQMQRTSANPSQTASMTQDLYVNQSTATPLTVSAYSKAENVSAGIPGEYKLYTTFYDSSGVAMGTVTVDYSPGTHGWERKALIFTPPRPVYRMFIGLVLHGNRTGTAWFDAVQVEDGTEASAWQAGNANGVDMYYLVRATRGAYSSGNTTWQLIRRIGANVITPTDFAIRELGSGFVEATWTPAEGTRYNIERSLSEPGSSYVPVAADNTTGIYRNAANLLVNSGFEDVYALTPVGWTGPMPSSVESGYTGRSYKQSRQDTTAPEQRAFQDVTLNQRVAEPLTLSGLLSGNCTSGTAGPDFGIILELFDAAGVKVGSGTFPGPVGCNTGWKKVTVTVTPLVPAKTARATLLMRGQVYGTGYFDNVQLETGTQATPWTSDRPTEGKTYAYRVVPIGATGPFGAPSGPVNLKITGVPVPATKVVAQAGANGRTDLSWTASPMPRATYSVYRSTEGLTPAADDRIGMDILGTAFSDRGNLIGNAGFDRDENLDGQPDGWDWISEARGGLMDSSTAKSGTASIKLVRAITTAAQQGLMSTAYLNQGEAAPVTFSGWSKTASIAGGSGADYTATVRLEGADGQSVAPDTILPFTFGNRDWEFRSVTITPTAPARRAVVQIYIRGNVTGTVWFDSLQLQPGTTASVEWIDGPVEPGRPYYYWVGTVGPNGKETLSQVVSYSSYPWKIASGSIPGYGLDDRWTFTDFPVPGGQAYLNVNTGNLVLTATDLVLPGSRLANVIRRTYNSLAPARTSPLGAQGWSLNVLQSLREEIGTGDILFTEGDGTELRFTRTVSGTVTTYTASPSVWMSLTGTSGAYAWKLARRDGVDYEFDTAGRMRRLSEPNGNAILYDYDTVGNLTAVRGPGTRQMTLEYALVGGVYYLTSIRDITGREYLYGYEGGRLVNVAGPAGSTVTYRYDTGGRLTAVTDAAGRGIQVTYNGKGQLASYRWEGVEGSTGIIYTMQGDLTRTDITQGITRPATTTLVTGHNGSLLELRDALGQGTRYEYDEWQRPVRIASPRGLVSEVRYEPGQPSPRVSQVIRHGEDEVVTQFEDYGPFDKPGLITDSTGSKTRMEYDAAGNLLAQTVGFGTPLVATTRYTYTSLGQPATVQDAEGYVTTYEVDDLGQIVALTNSVGGRSVYAYDATGNLTAATDPSGYQTIHSYDQEGRRVMTTYPDGGMAHWAYDQSGLLVDEMRPGGQRIGYQYDSAGRIVSSGNSQGNLTRWAYDEVGDQILILWPNGSRERKEYDALGRVLRTYDGENLTDAGMPVAKAAYREFSYDAAGNIVRVRLPNGYVSSAEYDLLNRVTRVIEPPATTTYAYDKAGRRLTQKDANGKWTRWSYDPLGRVIEVYDALNLNADGTMKAGAKATAYEYDGLGRRTKVRDLLGSETRYEYHPLGMLLREMDALGQLTLHTYDKAGRLLNTLDRNGNTTSYEYDAMGRTLQIHFEDDCDGVQFMYDHAGRRTAMFDSQGMTQYVYDELGRLITEMTPSGGIGYGYDAMGLRTAFHHAGGTVRYEYDQANRLREVTDAAGGVTRIRYNSSGDVANILFPGGAEQANVYEPASNRLLERIYSGPTSRLLKFGYGYDMAGNVTSVNKLDAWESSQSENISTYEYDDLYRLTAVKMNGTFQNKYTYNELGNRITEDAAGSVTRYEYNSVGWLSKSSYTAAGTTTPVNTQYAYDGQGNMLQSVSANRSERYTYNTRGLLVRAQVDKQFVSHEYDGDGRRVRRRVVTISVDGKETATQLSRYRYDGNFVAAELDGAGSLRIAYARMPGGRVLTWYRPGTGTIPDNSGAVLVDHLGSVVKMVKESNAAAVNQYSYDAFGRVSNLQETIGNDVKFTGAVLDGSGLYHLNARFYNPTVGRFITQDTYKGDPWKPWTQNLYTYVGNNPVNYVDPTGHWAVTIGVGGILAVVIGLKGEFDFALDDDGNYGLVFTGQGVSLGGGIGAGGSFAYYDVDTIDDLEGPIASVGGSLANIGVEGEFCRTEDGDFKICGLEGGYGFSGWGGSGYTAAGYTLVWNVKETVNWLFGE